MRYQNQGYRSLLRIRGGEGGIICKFTPILSYFQHWGDEPQPRFCSGEQIKRRPKNKKKGLRQKWNTFFPGIQVDTYAQMHTRVKLLGGCRCRPYTIGGDTVKLLGGDLYEFSVRLTWFDCLLYKDKINRLFVYPQEILPARNLFCWSRMAVRYASIFAKKYGTLVRYAFFVMVRVLYVFL